MFLAAAVQMSSRADKAQNLRRAVALVREAASQGAQLVGLPESFAFMGPDAMKESMAEPLSGPTLAALAQTAKELRIHLLAGSVLEPGGPEGRFYNTSVLFGPGGETLAVYRKIHLFDVEIPDGAVYRESKRIAPGSEVVACDTPLAKLGLSICFDLRFPDLYADLRTQGAQLLFVPAAFTLHTGKDHWEVLLRARAIETQCYVVAPAQVGEHGEGRRTYGNAMVVDPWGTVVARASDGEGMAIGPVDLAYLERVRRELPIKG